jgi:hypothetical protein
VLVASVRIDTSSLRTHTPVGEGLAHSRCLRPHALVAYGNLGCVCNHALEIKDTILCGEDTRYCSIITLDI